MCGIAGIVNLKGKPVNYQELREMTRLVIHRGPDDEGFLLANTGKGEVLTLKEGEEPQFPNTVKGWNLGLGHRRLSVIDLTSAGHQPMTEAEGKAWIVFNGEVFNFIELRDELKRKGYQFKSASDTEVVLNSYLEWGSDCLTRFEGMWAFAIYDLRKRLLWCARDPLGIKPFYYYYDEKCFAFASELKQFLALKGGKWNRNDAQVFNYLYHVATEHGEETFLRGIKRLLPAHWLGLDLHSGALTRQRYWQVNDYINEGVQEADAVAALRFLLESSVELRLRADVPVATCLSGGIDSTTVACLVQKIRKKQGFRENQHTFSAVYQDRKCDERRFINEALKAIKAIPHYVFPSEDELIRDLDRLIWCQDEPFFGTSVFAQWCVFKMVKECGIKVTLDGQGGDELFAGYETFYFKYFRELWKKGKKSVLVREMIKCAQFQGVNFLMKRYVDDCLDRLKANIPDIGATRLLRQRYRHKKNPVGASLERDVCLNREFIDSAGEKNDFPGNGGADHFADDEILNNALYYHSCVRGLNELFKVEDRNSMAFSVESRVPLVDYRIVKYSMALPSNYKIRGGYSKYILRQAVKGLVPDIIINRRDKLGFPTPEAQWMRQGLRTIIEDAMQSQLFRDLGYFNQEAIKTGWNAFLQGRLSYSPIIWRCFNLYQWIKLFKI